MLIGLPSNGLHTNGYSLARKLLFEVAGYLPDHYVNELKDKTGAALMRTHRSYLAILKKLIGAGIVCGMAHITGGGITENLPRILPRGTAAVVDLANWTVPPLFEHLQQLGNVTQDEMMRTFNMGIGMIVVVPAEQVKKAKAVLQPRQRAVPHHRADHARRPASHLQLAMKPLNETHPHLREFILFLDSLKQESARGEVLISATMLDDLLAQSIKARLLDHDDATNLLDGFNAPLGTFSARILAAFALGIISEREYKDLDTLRKIRNKFAHNVHVSFEDQQIADLSKNLTFAAQDYGDVKVGSRGRFSTAATALILNLTNRPHYVSEHRLAWQDWKY